MQLCKTKYICYLNYYIITHLLVNNGMLHDDIEQLLDNTGFL